MRSNQQKSRSRGRSSNNNNSRRNTNPLSRSYESNGPDVRVRGNAAHVAEKYVQLARDANMLGDSVAAENYLQHAEHYFRIISAAQAQVQTQQLAQQAAHQSQLAAQQARQAELKAAQKENGGEGNDGSPNSEAETNNAPVETGQPEIGGKNDTTGESKSPVDAVNEAVSSPARPARRPRRRPRTQERPDSASKPVAASRSSSAPSSSSVPSSDPAGAPQPEAGELPAFVTTGSESDAAE